MKIITRIIGSLVLVAIGFVVGFFVLRAQQPKTPEVGVSDQKPTSKFFDFFDTFTLDKEIGAIAIRFSYPDQHLFVFEYATSQETAEYGVYDYKNDIMYKNLGGVLPIGGTAPQAFVGSDKLLMYKVGQETAPELTIVDFDGKLIKTILTGEKVQEVYGHFGQSLIIRTGATNDAHTKNYILDVNTLELKPYVIN